VAHLRIGGTLFGKKEIGKELYDNPMVVDRKLILSHEDLCDYGQTEFIYRLSDVIAGVLQPVENCFQRYVHGYVKSSTRKGKKMPLDKLPPEVEAQLPAIKEKWLGYGLSTAPAARSDAEDGIREAYELAGLKAPALIEWLGSPKALVDVAKAEGINSPLICYGQHEAGWLAFFDVISRCGYDIDKLKGIIKVTQSAGWWWPLKDVCFVTERPNILNLDDRHRLHSTDEAGIKYPDGFAIHAVHGVSVPADIIENPESITVDRIRSEQNAEVRRVMIDKMTPEVYIQKSGAKQIDASDFGTLYRAEVPNDEALVMVRVTDGTPKNGKYEEYWLRVPPSITRAKDAVAWTYDMESNDYDPSVRT
jgi:hypothetical protein